MFGDGFFVGHPISVPRLVENSLWQNHDTEDLEDQFMNFMEPWNDRDLVLGPRAWVRPRQSWCPYTCMVNRPRRSTRRHFVILPRLARDDEDTMSISGIQRDKDIHLDASKTKDRNNTKERESLPNNRKTAYARSGDSEHSTSRKRKTCASSASGKGSSNAAQDSTAFTTNKKNSTSNTETCSAKGCTSPWQFSVDMSGCDEVRALTEGGMLMVEGRGSSDSSHKMMRYITSLPSHVNHDSLTAKLSNGHLTVTQKHGAQQLEGQARMLHIEIQEKEPQTKWQQQQTSGSTTEKQQKAPELATQQQQQKEALERDETQKSQASDSKQTSTLLTCDDMEESRQEIPA